MVAQRTSSWGVSGGLGFSAALAVVFRVLPCCLSVCSALSGVFGLGWREREYLMFVKNNAVLDQDVRVLLSMLLKHTVFFCSDPILTVCVRH